jgi:RNA polymerase sigma-70 factor, ECF subfamily
MLGTSLARDLRRGDSPAAEAKTQMDEWPSHSLTIEEMIARAKCDPQLLGELLQHYRPFLLLMLRPRIGPQLGVRCSASDVVQQTFVDACRTFDRFAGTTEPQFSAWIKRITEQNLKDAIRNHVGAQARSIDNERRLDGSDSTVSFHWREPKANQATASDRLIKGEMALRLAAALESLPEAQREAVCLRHLEGCMLEEIAKRLNRSLPAAMGLVKRGLQSLRLKMPRDSWNT